MDAPDPPGTPRRPHDPDPLKAYLEFDLAAELQRLREEPITASGRQARTLAKYDGLTVVLIAMHAGSHMAEHQTRGALAVHALSGHVRVHALGRTFDLLADRLLTLAPDVPHSLDAVTDTALVLTIGG
jgi:quercetin dioxygenase-like cupin family protein